MPDWEEKGTRVAAPLCWHVQAGQERVVYTYAGEGTGVGGGAQDKEGQKDNFVLYHETYNFTLTWKLALELISFLISFAAIERMKVYEFMNLPKKEKRTAGLQEGISWFKTPGQGRGQEGISGN